MARNDFTTTIIVDHSEQEVFNAIRNVRGWWSGLYGEEFEGDSEKLNDEFTFRAGEGMHYSEQKLVELIPDKKVVWLVTDSKLAFLKNTGEWTNTKICFEILKRDAKTEVRFTHLGLTPGIECYGSCAPAWTQYIQEKLLRFLTSGKGGR
jgi:hypothetical protein